MDGTSGGGASFCPRMGRVEGVHHSVLGWDEWRGCIIWAREAGCFREAGASHSDQYRQVPLYHWPG